MKKHAKMQCLIALRMPLSGGTSAERRERGGDQTAVTVLIVSEAPSNRRMPRRMLAGHLEASAVQQARNARLPVHNALRRRRVKLGSEPLNLWTSHLGVFKTTDFGLDWGLAGMPGSQRAAILHVPEKGRD